MNWTGGNLIRYSRGHTANEERRQQRQYFAKARQRKHGAPKQSPPANHSLLGWEFSHRGSMPSSGSRKTPSSFPPISPGLAHAANSPNHQGWLDPILLRGEVSSQSHPKKTHRAGSSPISPASARKRRLFSDLPGNGGESSDAQNKKRRLLYQSDWVGLSVGKPLGLHSGNRQEARNKKWSAINQDQHEAARKRRHEYREYKRDPFSTILENARFAYADPFTEPVNVKIGSQITKSTSGNHYEGNQSPVRSEFSYERYLSQGYEYGSSMNSAQKRLPGVDGLPRAGKGSRGIEEYEQDTQESERASSESKQSPQRGLDHFRSDGSGSMSTDTNLIPMTRGSSLPNSPHFQPALMPITSCSSQRTSSPAVSLGRSNTAARTDKAEPARSDESDPLFEVPGIFKADSPSEEIGIAIRRQSHVNLSNKQSNSHVPPLTDIFKAQTEEEENKVWMKFLFPSEADEKASRERVFKEAAHSLAYELRPSDPEILVSPESMDSDRAEAATSSEIPRISSEEAHLQGCSEELTSDDRPQASEIETIDTVQMEPRSTDTTGEPSSDTGRQLSEADTMNTTQAEPPSTKDSPAEEGPTFRFAAPPTFVGNLTVPGDERGQSMLVLPPPPSKATGGKTRGRQGRRRSKKMRDGRADIRGLPDFDDDPIEDSES